MQHRRIILFSSIAGLVALPAHAELNLWQQNFVGCSTSASPYVNDVLFKDTTVTRPLMQIAGMQAWAVPDGKGGKQLAMTTPDGLTIYGRVVGPHGEDISGALLGMPLTTSVTTAPTGQVSLLGRPTSTGGSPTALSPGPPPVARSVVAQMPSQPVPLAESQPSIVSSNADLAQAQHLDAAASSPTSTSTPPLSLSNQSAAIVQSAAAAPNPPLGAQAGIGSQTVLDVPKASGLDELIKQAETFAMWAPMNKPEPDAPIVYMFVDPTCPHCAWSLDHLESKIRDGSVALRMIMAPILSEEAIHIGISIIQSDNPGDALLQQAKLAIGSRGKAVERLDPTQYDQRVKDGISRNVQWMRANGIPGVPFYLYRTAQKAEFAFGSLSDAQLATAIPGNGGTTSSEANASGPSPAGTPPIPSSVTGAVK